MRPLSSRRTARAFDRRIMDAGVPGLLLMENAGRGAADLLIRRFRERLQRPVVVGGMGQNGGDAWVVARRLKTLGISPTVFLLGSAERVSGDAKVNLDALAGIEVEVTEVDDLAPMVEALASASVVVDGVFGTGLDRPIEGFRARVIEHLATIDAPVFALDLPSGVDADTGAVLGVAVRAELTATFASHKRGLWQSPGRDHAGEVVCLDIGVPGPASDEASLLQLADSAGWLAPRAIAAHKGSAGHVLVLAGSVGKTGAALLSGHGALRAGAGLVTIAARRDAYEAIERKVVELMTAPLPQDDPLATALELAKGKTTAVVGPGLGLDERSADFARALAAELPLPTVLDADALTALAAKGFTDLRDVTAPRVITPHPGEAARLLGISVAEVEADRYGAAKKLANRCGHVAVLKGAGTVIADASGRVAVCPLGTPALGVAGTGDVLSGALGAVLAAVDDPFHAACAAVTLHARAGEIAGCADRGLRASEVADRLPVALTEAREAARVRVSARLTP